MLKNDTATKPPDQDSDANLLEEACNCTNFAINHGRVKIMQATTSSVAALATFLSFCTEFTKISLASCVGFHIPYLGYDVSISPETLIALAESIERSPKVTTIKLRGIKCNGMNSDRLRRLLLPVFRSAVQSIEMSECDWNYTGDLVGAADLSEEFRNLKQLRFSKCSMFYRYIGTYFKNICWVPHLSGLSSVAFQEEWLSIWAGKGLGAMLQNNKFPLQELDLSHNGIEKEGAKALVDALFGYNTLRTLDISANNLGVEGAMQFSYLLARSTSLLKLDMSSDRMGDACAVEIAKALGKNRTLTELSLDDNRIGPEGAVQLGKVIGRDNRRLVSLSLSGNLIGNEGAKSISLVIKENSGLTYLDLCKNSITEGCKHLIDALSDNRRIKTFNLAQNMMSKEACDALGKLAAKNATLSELTLNECRIADVTELSRGLLLNHSLTALLLGVNPISDPGVVALATALAKNETMKTLDLTATEFGPTGAAALAKLLGQTRSLVVLAAGKNPNMGKGAFPLMEAVGENRSLHELYLDKCGIKAATCKKLADAIAKNQTLQLLSISMNDVGLTGTKALAEAIGKNKALRTLDISLNKLGNNGATALAKGLEQNTTLLRLHIEDNRIQVPGMSALAEALEKSKALRKLWVGTSNFDRNLPIMVRLRKAAEVLGTLSVY